MPIKCCYITNIPLFFDTSIINIPNTNNVVRIDIDQWYQGVLGAKLCLDSSIYFLEASKRGEPIYVGNDQIIVTVEGEGDRVDIINMAIKELKSWPFNMNMNGDWNVV